MQSSVNKNLERSGAHRAAYKAQSPRSSSDEHERGLEREATKDCGFLRRRKNKGDLYTALNARHLPVLVTQPFAYQRFPTSSKAAHS
jgi:hypothetical protein